MTTAEYFKTIDLDEIERFIVEGQEENVSLEFKTVNHPYVNDKSREFDKKNFSEVLSGFANSTGGIVIWGVKAKENSLRQDVAHDKAPINELTKFLNYLNKLEGQAVIPIITGVVHEKIDLGNDTGFIKTYIPPSDSAPHMGLYGGKQYYKRSGDSFYQCEHYDIIDMFARKRSPDLNLVARVLMREDGQNNNYRYEIVLMIENKGKVLAKYPGLSISCDHRYSQYSHGLDGNSGTGLERVANNILYRYNYSGGINTVIYPGTTLDVDKFITVADKNEVPEDFDITYILSAEGMENRTGKLKVDVRTILTASLPMPQ